jgi:hypothetical protein
MISLLPRLTTRLFRIFPKYTRTFTTHSIPTTTQSPLSEPITSLNDDELNSKKFAYIKGSKKNHKIKKINNNIYFFELLIITKKYIYIEMNSIFFLFYIYIYIYIFV